MNSLRQVCRINGHALEVLLALLMILPCVGSAGQVAPVPVEPGEFYVGASYGSHYFDGVTFRAHEMFEVVFEEDNGTFTQRYSFDAPSHGYLINHETDTNEWIPEVHFGYALKEQIRGGTIRVEGSASLWDRKDSHYTSSWNVPNYGVETILDDNPGNPPSRYNTGLWAAMPMIDGKYNYDGTPFDADTSDDFNIIAAWAFSVAPGTDPVDGDAMIFDNDYSFKQTAGGGDFAVFYDTKYGKWRFSQGFGISYEYLRTHHWNSYYFEKGNNASYAEYDHKLESHMFGGMLQYSAGIQPVKFGPTFFTTGKMRVKLVMTELTANQYAPGLTSTSGLQAVYYPRQYNTGSRHYETSDGHLGFSGDLGAGISQRILFTRVTLYGGGSFEDGLPTPEDKNGQFKIRYKSMFGYYARASVDIAF